MTDEEPFSRPQGAGEVAVEYLNARLVRNDQKQADLLITQLPVRVISSAV